MKKFKILKVVGLFLFLALTVMLLVRCEKDPVLDSKYIIKATSVGIGGAVSPSIIEVAKGKNAAVALKPDSGYDVDVVKVDGNIKPVPTNLIYNFSEVVADHNMEVTWKKIFIVNVSVSTGGSANSLGIKEVTEGDNLDITFNPNMGYKASSVMVNGVSSPLTSNVYSLKNISADTEVMGVFEMSSMLRLFTQEKWKLDSLFIREPNGTWSRYAQWGVLGEHQQVLTLLPDGTFKVDIDGNPGDGPWSFDNTKNPPLFHMGMTQFVPEGAVAEIEKLDETSLVLASYNVPNVDPNVTTKGAVRLKYSHLNN